MNNHLILIDFRDSHTPGVTNLDQFKQAIAPLIALGFFDYQSRGRNSFMDLKASDRQDRSIGSVIKSDYLIALSNTLAPLCQDFQGFNQQNCDLDYSTNWQEAFFKIQINLDLKAYNPYSPDKQEDVNFLRLSYNLLSFFQYHYGWNQTRLPCEHSSHCYASMNELILRRGEFSIEKVVKPVEDLLVVSCLKEVPGMNQSFDRRMFNVLKRWIQANDRILAKAIGEQINCGTSRRKFVNNSFYADQRITA